MSHLGRNARRIAMFTTCMATLTASQLCSAALLDGMWPFNSNEEKHLQAWEPDPTQALRWGEWERLKLAPSGTNTPNQHPVQLSPEQIAKTLMSIQVRPFHDDYPLFSEEELKRFATPIAIALAKAAPNQDVEFLSMGQHGIIGIGAHFLRRRAPECHPGDGPKGFLVRLLTRFTPGPRVQFRLAQNASARGYDRWRGSGRR